MRRRLRSWIGAAAALGVAGMAAGAGQVDTARVTEVLRTRVEAGGIPSRLVIDGHPVRAALTVPEAYERRGFEPLWIGPGGLRRAATELAATLAAAGDDGLDPQDYAADTIAALLGQRGVRTAGEWADLDILLTDGFLTLGGHLVSGRVNPETFDPEWLANRREVDLLALLATAASDGRVRDHLLGLRPQVPGYDRLRSALVHYRGLAAAGGWSAFPGGAALKPGGDDSRVPVLRQRLAVTGDLPAGSDLTSSVYDDDLLAAVRRFQSRHGLEIDGVVGTRSVEELSVPAATRVRQIEVNLERWRWLPQDLGARYVIVNIPDFDLRVVANDEDILRMRVVVGRPYRRTPVFSDSIRYAVFNPSWEVPPSIATRDKLPLLRENPATLVADGFQVFRGFDAQAQPVDPLTVDWNAVTSRGFPYRLRQAPGPKNALGVVKFMFPNRFNVYLHDTPSRDLFARTDRGFSSGCIRVERPLDLAQTLLADVPGWDRTAIDACVAAGSTRTVNLPRPIPVHLQYWTAWSDEDGTVQFRRDLYGRDDRLLSALSTRN